MIAHIDLSGSGKSWIFYEGELKISDAEKLHSKLGDLIEQGMVTDLKKAAKKELKKIPHNK